MKLSVSNIAWEVIDTPKFLSLLSQEGCQGLEFCPSMLWKEPITAPLQEVKSFEKLVRSHGLELCSMHSLTFPHPDLNFFELESRKKLVSYIVELSKLAGELKIPVMVFGGKSRKIGDRDRKECHRIIVDTCREMAQKLEPSVSLLIEPLSHLDMDCINNMQEGMELVEEVNHKNFGLHIDLKASFAEKEDQDLVWTKYGSFIRHCHVSDPGMKPPSSNCPDHYKAAAAMKKAGYNHYLSLEIGRVGSPEVLQEALQFVRKVYLN